MMEQKCLSARWLFPSPRTSVARAFEPRLGRRAQQGVKCSASREVELPLPEGNLGLPFFGETFELVVAGDTFGTTRRRKYGDVYKTNILGSPTVMVYGEDAVRSVLGAEDRLIATDWPQVTGSLVGPNSLNLLTGQRHSSAKRALSEAFSDRQVGGRVPRIAELVQAYVALWAAGPQPAQGYEACQELSQAVFDAVVLGGDGSPGRAARLKDIMARLQAGFQTPPIDLFFTDYGKALAARREFGGLVNEAIACLRSSISHSSTPTTATSTTTTTSSSSNAGPATSARECALAFVLASAALAASSVSGEGAGATTTAEAILDSVLEDNMTAAFFGNASTGPTLAKALQNLAACPDVLERLRSEQEDIIARCGTDITAAVLDEMSYGSAVAKELLRITPAVPAVFRIAVEDFELQGRRIPKGWRVWCHLGDSVLKYNMDIFDPDRWNTSLTYQPAQTPTTAPRPPSTTAAAPGGCPAHARASAAKPEPEYSLPFGSGARTCLGRNLVVSELMVLLAVLARGYEWEAVTSGEEWRVVPAPAPKEGLRVNLRRRQQAG